MSQILNDDYLSEWFFIDAEGSTEGGATEGADAVSDSYSLKQGPILIETISLQTYVEDIIHSFGMNLQNAVKQFHLDIERSVFNYENEMIDDSDIAYGIITNSLKLDSRQKRLLITLCTQASLAKPLEIIMKYLGTQYCVLETNSADDKLYFKYSDNELLISKKMRIIKTDSTLFVTEINDNNFNDQNMLSIDVFIPLTTDYRTEDATFCYTIE